MLRPFLMVFLALTLLATAGCVRSRVRVTSEPEGAIVTMNGVNLGPTPVEHPFTWYWYYDFEARMEGYESAETRERFRAPVYLWVPFDLVMEMMPFYVTDTKRVHLVLEKSGIKPDPVFISQVD